MKRYFLLILILSSGLMVSGCSSKATSKISDHPSVVHHHPPFIHTLISRTNESGRPAVISALGCSVTYGVGTSKPANRWLNELVIFLRQNEAGLQGLIYHNDGYPGHTTSDLIKQHKTDVVIKQKPDVILFETCLLNDHSHGIPIGITLKNINNIVTQLKTKLPHTRIILMSDPPRIKSGPNAIGLSYADYLEKTKEYAQAKHWEYIDVYKGFEKQRLSDGLALHQVMYDNNSHPNDIGYAYWYKILRKYFLTGQQ